MNYWLKTVVFLVVISSCSVILISCNKDADEEYRPSYSSVPIVMGDDDIFIIGVHPMHNPKMMQKIFDPIADYLSKNIEGSRFIIEGSPDFKTYNKKLKNRKFHLSLPNPFQTIGALKYGYNVFAKMAGDDTFRGVILARKDSHIKMPIDLKGSAMSFPAETALAATMMTQYYLQKNGLNVMKDLDIKYVGSQESAVMNVMLGNSKAGGSWLPAWRMLSKKRPKLAEELEVVWKTESLPNNSFIARDDMNQKVVNKVKHLLLQLNTTSKSHQQHGATMKKKKRFEAANNQTYDPVVEFLMLFEKEVRVIH